MPTSTVPRMSSSASPTAQRKLSEGLQPRQPSSLPWTPTPAPQAQSCGVCAAAGLDPGLRTCLPALALFLPALCLLLSSPTASHGFQDRPFQEPGAIVLYTHTHIHTPLASVKFIFIEAPRPPAWTAVPPGRPPPACPQPCSSSLWPPPGPCALPWCLPLHTGPLEILSKGLYSLVLAENLRLPEFYLTLLSATRAGRPVPSPQGQFAFPPRAILGRGGRAGRGGRGLTIAIPDETGRLLALHLLHPN